MPADLKPTPRVRDRYVYVLFHDRNDRCLHCRSSRDVEAAHLLRGVLREDVLAGLIPLCHRCHEAFDKNLSYLDGFGKVTPSDVKRTVAWFLRDESGADQAAYLIRRLGAFGAEHYVQKLEAA